MNRVFVILIITITFAALIHRSIKSSAGWSNDVCSIVSIENGEAVRARGEHEYDANIGDELRRGEIIKTADGFVAIECGESRIALAKNTEAQVLSADSADGRVGIKLIGGRIFSYGLVEVITPWINAGADGKISVVNYSWRGEVDIIPIESATVYVDNNSVGRLPITLPSTWVESEKRMFTAIESFDFEKSSEHEFYEFSLQL
jgi:hypothetical protein